MKRLLKIVSAILMIALAIFASGCNKAPTEQMEEAVINLAMPENEDISIEKIGDGSLILVKCNVDYKFGDYLKKGANTDQEQFDFLKEKGFSMHKRAGEFIKTPFMCSSYSAFNESGDLIFGRNMDTFGEDTGLLIYTRPSGGYASVSITNGALFGYENAKSDIEDIKKYMPGAAYFPIDGMNECGLTIAENSVYSKTPNDPGKITIGSHPAMRLVLDYAKDVDEAVALLNKYNIYFTAGNQTHYMISDAAGRSAIVEFVKGEMKVVKNSRPWQVSTNFLVSFLEEGDNGYSRCERYKIASETLNRSNGVLSGQEAMALLEEVSQNGILWSSIYNKSTGEIKVAMKRNYGRIYRFKMDMKEGVSRDVLTSCYLKSYL